MWITFVSIKTKNMSYNFNITSVYFCKKNEEEPKIEFVFLSDTFINGNYKSTYLKNNL